MGQITVEYRQRMYALREFYGRPYPPEEPVTCGDEKSKQRLKQTRVPLAARRGAAAKEDYEYERAGTGNLFGAVEPKGQRRQVEVTARRTQTDFVAFVLQWAQQVYAGAQRLQVVLDNLHTPFRSSFEAVWGREAAQAVLRRVEFHYPPKQARWLNLAELEIGLLEKQGTGRRMATPALVAAAVAAWQPRRNAEKRGLEWQFTREKADQNLGRHYVT